MRRSSLRLGAIVTVFASTLIACGSDSNGTTATTDGAVSSPDSASDTLAANDTGSRVDSGAIDSGAIDSGAIDSGAATEETGTDGGGAVDCTGKPDGTDCGGGSICVKGLCAGSSCGDGYVDGANGEECDDANAVSGDGCSLCKFDCKAAADCDNGNVCDGAETCNASTHVCGSSSAPADGTTCTLAAGGSGTCKAKACVKAGCGNSLVEAGEDCDDGDTDDTDGCTKLCRFTCATAADCDDGNKCNGTETCDATTHKCSAGTAVTCSPKTGCTGTCDPATGACTYPDADKDGSPCDKDCIDADPAVFPGAYECKDGKDNDCDGSTADGTAPSCICFADPDRDGYAGTGASTVSSAGACPDAYTRRPPADAASTDCAIYNASAHPGQRAWFSSTYCKTLVIGSCPLSSISWDYDCSGAAEKRWTTSSSISCPGATSAKECLVRSGWIGAAPACGASGSYRTCTWSSLSLSCSGTETSRKQECH
ncbi:MAG: hypothetical protein HYV09_37700 [Deltaproteobacteria bacterium]|nr:hypothetical protein [Deltaproteobacteria bacterium]